MKPTEYVIENVADLLSVPQDRWDALLADLHAWMSFRAQMETGLAELIGAGHVELPRRFIWIDDGKMGLNRIRLIPAEVKT